MDRRRRQNQPSVVPKENELLQKPPRFGSFSDQGGYNGRPPSAAILKSACETVMEGREHWYHRQQQLVDGTNLAGDESHKVVKAIRVSHEKVFHGVYTIINEYGQVVMQVRGCDAEAAMGLSTGPMLTHFLRIHTVPIDAAACTKSVA